MINLIIVAAIIAIHAAIAIPACQGDLIRTQVTEGSTLAGGAKVAVSNSVSHTGRFPPGNEGAGMAKSASIKGSHVSRVEAKDSRIKVLFGGPKANRRIRSASLVLSPISRAGSIDWSCKPGSLDGKHLRSACHK